MRSVCRAAGSPLVSDSRFSCSSSPEECDPSHSRLRCGVRIHCGIACPARLTPMHRRTGLRKVFNQSIIGSALVSFTLTGMTCVLAHSGGGTPLGPLYGALGAAGDCLMIVSSDRKNGKWVFLLNESANLIEQLDLDGDGEKEIVASRCAGGQLPGLSRLLHQMS